MRPDGDVICLGQRQGFLHHQWVASMKTAGNVGLVDVRHYRFIQAHFPGAVAFAEIAIEH